ESLLAYDRVQIPASSLGAHAKHCRMPLRELLPFRGEGLGKIGDIARRRSQILHPVPTFFEQLVRSIKRLFHHSAHRLAGCNAVGRRLKSQDQPLHSLQERVMKLARDSLALGETRFQATADL